MSPTARTQFLNRHERALTAFWDRHHSSLAEWKRKYEWPRGIPAEESLKRRDDLAKRVSACFRNTGFLSLLLFDEVMIWGFGMGSGLSEADVCKQTGIAYRLLGQERYGDAAIALMQLRGIGVSRATKIIALSDQDNLGIYDSRAAHGLSDLVDAAGRRIVTIPPGRVIRGDIRPKGGYGIAFLEYTWVLQHLHGRVRQDAILREQFPRVADLEIAFFSRSKSENLTYPSSAPEHLAHEAEMDEDEMYWTLGAGGKARKFWARFDQDSVTVWTGKDAETPKKLTLEQIDECLRHFSQMSFPLSNSVEKEKRDPNGLGAYFADKLKCSSKFASHFAALFVSRGWLQQLPNQGGLWFRVKNLPSTEVFEDKIARGLAQLDQGEGSRGDQVFARLQAKKAVFLAARGE